MGLVLILPDHFIAFVLLGTMVTIVRMMSTNVLMLAHVHITEAVLTHTDHITAIVLKVTMATTVKTTTMNVPTEASVQIMETV